ncbi:Electron transfer flavoprotein, alpha/beta-subunit-like protein [Alkaliphilus metalliredigens QYMF]|uniref:Electron transfer flavoprotein small subunit n=2 Tax=Alkaliphilus TaxID=114627 RepID=A6TKF2_ALKMQ|nr:Electron transfer flavoprotein, alpha/beta-subunit-like protein [Alkaliphilus metalliredigens QYMF]
MSEKIEAEIIVLSMGPPSAENALREAIARGAHKGILLSDRKFGGSDVKATALTLSAGINHIGDYDLIIAGMQTVDGDTGQVGAEVAEILGIPQISYVEELNDFDDESVTVTTNIWEGLYLKKIKFPALMTVTKEINDPRLPSFKNKMKARKAEITLWGQNELRDYLREDQIGLKGSATKVKKIEVPAAAVREGKLWRDNHTEAVDVLYDLFEVKKVLEG